MNKFRFFTFITIMLGAIHQDAIASHSMGSDLTYRCLGGNQYEITLSFYRDCAGIPADQTATIDISSSCFTGGSVILSLIPGTGQEITPLCPSQVSTCNGGLFTGIQEYIYRGVVTLPGACADWNFSYNLCCRNNAITNIDFPGSTQIYVFATLNNLITQCNNSPTFSNKPVPFVCLGQQYCYNHGAYDVDGDSLVYTVITPYDSPGFPVWYNGAFSPNNPLTSSPAMTFNTANGDICMTPTNLEVTVMAVLVSEYRNGVLIGSVERDIQVTVIDCNNQLPVVSGINGTNSFSASVCAGSQLCFNITSSDANAPQNTTISWDQSIPGASFTVTPGNRESATFCWTPTVANISANPYCFTVLVQDDNCPFLGSQVFSYCITVRGLTVNAGPNLSVGCNSNATVTATAAGGGGNYTYSWSNGSNGSTISASPGTYIVTASDGTCTAKDTVQVLAGTNTPTSAFTMAYSCSGLSVQMANQSSIVGGTISGYEWQFGDGNTSTAVAPSHTYASTGQYQVMLITTAVGGCVDTTIQSLNLVNDPPNALFSLQNACVGTQVNFANQSTSISAISSYAWTFGDGNSSNVPSPANVYNTVGTFQVKLVISNANGCSDSITQSVTVYPLPIPNAGNPVSICEGTSTTLNGSGGGSYLWNPGNVTSSSLSVTPSQNTTYTLTVTDANGCEATADVQVTVNPTPTLNNIPDRSICDGGSVTLAANAIGNPNYIWNPGAINNSQITVSPLVTTTYIVTATNNSGCSSSDTVEVVVNPIPVMNTNSSDVICFGAANGTASVLVTSGANPLSYSWSGGAGNSATANGLGAGTFTVTVTDANGCIQTGSATIAEPPALNLVTSDSPVLCFGGNTGSAGVITTGGTPNYSYLWNSAGATTAAINNLIAGTYTVVVTDNNSCTQTVSVIVPEPPALNIVTGSVAVQCFGMSNGSTSVIASGGTPNYSYSWSSTSSTNSSVTGLPIGNYSVVVTDANSCSTTSSIQVTQPSLLELSTATTPAACATVTNGTASVTVTGGSTSYSYAWTPSGATTANASGLSSGNYSILITDANGCTVGSNVAVGSIGGPTISAGTKTDVACNGGNTGSASINVSTGTPPYNINWSPSGGSANQASNLSAGTYTANVTDNNGCPATYQVTIAEPTAITSASTNTSVTCFGGNNGTATVSASGGTSGYTYQWSSGAGTNSTATGLSTGNYSVIISDANACTHTENIIIAQPTALNISTSSTPALCFGSNSGSTSAVVSGGTPVYSYNWSNGGGTLNNAAGLAAGNYSVIVTDANSCTSTASVAVTQPTALQQATSSTPASCSAIGNGTATVVASGGLPGYTYSWSPSGGNLATASGLVPGVYTNTITDANGCTASTPVNVGSIGGPAINPASQTNVSCFGQNDGSGSVNISAGTPPYSISWSPSGGNNSQASNLSAGIYTVSVSDNNGCLATQQITIIQPAALSSTISKTDVTCFGLTNGSAIVGASGGTSPFTYNWNPGGAGSDVANNLPAGNYSVVITDAHGCSKTMSTSISQPTGLIPVINATQLLCHGDLNGSVSVSISGGVPGYNYLWSPGGATNGSMSGLGNGNYSVSITDANGCVIVASTSIIEPAPITLSLIGATTICIGQSTILSAIPGGGTRPYQYLWNTGETDSSHSVNPLTLSSYSVQIVDSNGCTTSSQPIQVNVYPPLTVLADDLGIICEGDNAQISALAAGGNGGPYTYSWNQGAIVGSTSAIYPTGDSIFIVTATDACGTPAAMDTINIAVHPLPQVAFLPHSIEGCTPVNAVFANHTVAPPGSSYIWSLGDNTSSTDPEPQHEYEIPGYYDVTLTVMSPEGCSSTLTIPQAVRVYGFPLAAFSQSASEITVLNPGIAFYNESLDAVDWEWDFGDGTDYSNEPNPVHEFPDSGTYTIRLIVHSAGGCADTIYSIARVEMEFIINVPSSFTPNGDGRNDGFKAYGIGYTDYSMWILDRWGRKIYHSTDRTIAWDGTYFGNKNQCQADVYEWVLDVLDFKGRTHRLIGHVTLYR